MEFYPLVLQNCHLPMDNKGIESMRICFLVQILGSLNHRYRWKMARILWQLQSNHYYQHFLDLEETMPLVLNGIVNIYYYPENNS